MKENSFVLFTEINRSSFIFIAGKHNNNQNFEISEKIIVPVEGIHENKLTNVDLVIKIIEKNVATIEKKLNHVFKEVHVIIDLF